MDELRDLIARQADADAARLSGDEFVSAFGAAVTGRVRRRRRVRAAGTAGASALAVGLLAVGFVALPPVFEPAQPGPGGGACVEAPWPHVTGPDGQILWGAGSEVSFSLTSDELQVTEGGTTTAVPVRDGLLEGTSVSGEDLDVTMPSGTIVTVSLLWTESEISVTASDGPEGNFSVQMPRFADVSAVDLERRYHGVDVSSAFDLPTWYVWDDATNVPALTVTSAGTDEFTVTTPDGAEQTFPLGDDGIATVDWTGEVLIALEMTGEELRGSVQVDDLVTSPVDATLASAPFCLPPQLAGEDQATNDAAPVSQDPSPLPATSGVESPFACGFEFPSETYSVDGLSVEDARWIDPLDARERIRAAGVARQIDGEDPMPMFVLRDATAGPNVLTLGNLEDPILSPPDASDMPDGVTYGQTFVVVSAGVVIATIPDPWEGPAGQVIAWGAGDQDQLILTDPVYAFTGCPGVDYAADPEIYAVVGRVALDVDGTPAPPVYAWSVIERP